KRCEATAAAQTGWLGLPKCLCRVHPSYVRRGVARPNSFIPSMTALFLGSTKYARSQSAPTRKSPRPYNGFSVTMEISHIIQFVARHGYTLIFVWVLAEQAALPIPSFPLLLVSGALVRTGELRLSPLLTYALLAAVIADNVWFQVGRRYSGRALQ